MLPPASPTMSTATPELLPSDVSDVHIDVPPGVVVSEEWQWRNAASDGLKSDVWRFFMMSSEDKKNGKNAKCMICIQDLTYDKKGGSTSNMLKHLVRKHAEEYYSFKQANGLPISKPTTLHGKKKRKSLDGMKNPAKRNKKSMRANSVGPLGRDGHPAHLKPIDKGVSNNKRFMQWCIRDLRPFSILEDPGFRAYIRGLNPKYFVPRLESCTKYLNELFVKTQYSIEQQIKEIQEKTYYPTQFSLQIDAWAYGIDEAIGAVGVTYSDEFFTPHSLLLGIQVFSGIANGINLSGWVYGVLEKYKLSFKRDISCIITDHGKELVEPLYKMHPNIDHFGQFAENVQQAISKAFDAESTTGTDASKRELQTHLNSLLIKCRHNDKQDSSIKVPGLEVGVPSWSSLYGMFYRLLYFHQFDETPCLDFSETEWKVLHGLVTILKPCALLLDVLQSEISHISLSNTVPLLLGIKQIMAPNQGLNLVSIGEEVKDEFLPHKMVPDTVRYVKSVILEELERSTQLPEIALVACALDPRYKHLKFLSEAEQAQVWDKVKCEVRDLVTNDPPPTLPPQTFPSRKSRFSLQDVFGEKYAGEIVQHRSPNTADDELSRYQSEAGYSPHDSDQDPLVWWTERKFVYPYLSTIAKYYLTTPATSTTVRRACTAAVGLFSDRRNRQSQVEIQKMVYVHVNSDSY